ncbi:putative DNA-binding transcriptional regulator YafY [Lipingzhangella halophila]|uniref:Putative DNA-binding transcriptional regulator YafY n=1 Tax=Lipingzhangella halophila TaxID=1783352 RepID=A0A7W7RIQ9_9ACTN|nr:YafY family protein [Lipingzhangella halophila]MBB4932675.1 putative DNA-binding transcriptional regulator YafY [Lipingzhangella halophila]
MPEKTSARLLRLLSLLQAKPDWTSAELAERMAVTPRTIRRDVDRLRGLGYPIESTPGAAGGYRLGPGGRMPPLLLDDEEAVAVAVGLGTAAQGSVTGIGEASVRALAKLDQVLPPHLRRRLETLQGATVMVHDGDEPTVDHETLVTMAAACRSRERLRFDYVRHDGSGTRRLAEPHRLVSLWGRWYLVAWDVDREDWRSFRADRVTPRLPTGPRFAPRADPEGDVAAFLYRRLGARPWATQCRVLVHAPAERIAEHGMGVVEPVDDTSCLLRLGGESIPMVAVWIGALDTDFEVLDPPELREHVAVLAERYRRAAGRRDGS